MKLSIDQIKDVLKEKIPEGLVVPEHTKTEHYYRHVPTNQLFGSVTARTGILNEDKLKRWSARLAVEYIDKNWNVITPDNKADIFEAAMQAHVKDFNDAGGIGTLGHGVIERYLKSWIEFGKKPRDIRKFIDGTDSRLWAISRSAEMFFNDFHVTPIASELLVTSLRYKYAGTLDGLVIVRNPATRKDLLVLLDFKTSNSIKEAEYAMQTAAYWQALYEMTGLKPRETIIVHLNKEQAKYGVYRLFNRPAAFRAFRHCSHIYDFLNNGISKVLPFVPRQEVILSPSSFIINS